METPSHADLRVDFIPLRFPVQVQALILKLVIKMKH